MKASDLIPGTQYKATFRPSLCTFLSIHEGCQETDDGDALIDVIIAGTLCIATAHQLLQPVQKKTFDSHKREVIQ